MTICNPPSLAWRGGAREGGAPSSQARLCRRARRTKSSAAAATIRHSETRREPFSLSLSAPPPPPPGLFDRLQRSARDGPERRRRYCAPRFRLGGKGQEGLGDFLGRASSAAQPRERLAITAWRGEGATQEGAASDEGRCRAPTSLPPLQELGCFQQHLDVLAHLGSSRHLTSSLACAGLLARFVLPSLRPRAWPIFPSLSLATLCFFLLQQAQLECVFIPPQPDRLDATNPSPIRQPQLNPLLPERRLDWARGRSSAHAVALLVRCEGRKQ